MRSRRFSFCNPAAKSAVTIAHKNLLGPMRQGGVPKLSAMPGKEGIHAKLRAALDRLCQVVDNKSSAPKVLQVDKAILRQYELIEKPMASSSDEVLLDDLAMFGIFAHLLHDEQKKQTTEWTRTVHERIGAAGVAADAATLAGQEVKRAAKSKAPEEPMDDLFAWCSACAHAKRHSNWPFLSLTSCGQPQRKRADEFGFFRAVVGNHMLSQRSVTWTCVLHA